jgi:hypothetical protein
LIPILIVLPTVISHYRTYATGWTCWVNFSSDAMMGELLPMAFLAWVTIILCEAAGMDSHLGDLASVDAAQRTTAVISKAGLMIMAPLSAAALMVASFAVFHHNIYAYTVAFGVNMGYIAALMFFRVFSNTKVRNFFGKCFKFIRK